MNNNHSKNNSPVNAKAKATTKGEAPQEHGVKGKTKSKNPESEAARRVLIELSQQAQDMMKLMENGAEIEGFEDCEGVNDFLVVMYENSTGCKTFKTFQDWKKAGFSVKKGSKGFRVWGSPLKVKKGQDAEQTDSKEEGAEKKFKFWPVCCLFNESQVEKTLVDGENTEGVVVMDASGPSANDTVNHQTSDLGNNESLKRGLFPVDGGFLAMTYTESKPLKTKAGALAWLARRGIDERGEEIPQEATEKDSLGENSPFVTADYQDRLEQKREGLEARAIKASTESTTVYARAKDMASVIPFGQPILVGHHSEKRDRNYRERIHTTFKKSFSLAEKSEYLEQKAERVGTGGIASNDPEALLKLKEKLANLVKSQEVMKSVNKIIKSPSLSNEEKKAEIIDSGLLKENQAAKILSPDCFGGIGFASYSLSNNNAEIRRVRARIEGLERLRDSEPLEHSCEAYDVTVNDGRICFNFHSGKPSGEARGVMKRGAFKWSRYQSAWVRKATGNALAEAKYLIKKLGELKAVY